jgi:hypothetical protein
MWKKWWATAASSWSSATWPASPTTTSIASRTKPTSVVRRRVPRRLIVVALATLLSPVHANQARVSAV